MRNNISDELEKEFDAIPSDEEIMKMYKLSEKHEQKMQEMFAGLSKDNSISKKDISKKRKCCVYMFYKIAAVILLVIVFTAISFKYVPQVLAYFEAENMKVVVKESVEFGEIDKNSTTQTITDLKFGLGYVPDGYEFESERYNSKGDYAVNYRHSNGGLLNFYYRNLEGTKMQVGIEKYEKVNIKGIQYYIFISNGEENSFVVWEQKGYVFGVSGCFEKSLLLYIAENIILR